MADAHKKLLDAIYDHKAVINLASDRLYSLAQHFGALGLDRPAEKLFKTIQELELSMIHLHGAYSDSQNERFAEAQESVGNVLLAFAAGAGRKNND